MISCPAAKQMRWVKPSMATVSPSRTRSATASRIEVTLPVSGTSGLDRFSSRWDGVVGAAKNAELVPFRVLHHGPCRLRSAEALEDRRPKLLQPRHLLVAGSRRPEVEVQSVFCP